MRQIYTFTEGKLVSEHTVVRYCIYRYSKRVRYNVTKTFSCDHFNGELWRLANTGSIFDEK